MKHTKKLAWLLALLVLLGTSCNGEQKPAETDGKPSDGTAGTKTETEAETVDLSGMSFTERLSYTHLQWDDGLPDADYDGADCRIGYLDNQSDADHILTDDWIAEELTGEAINDSVFNRNQAVADRFHVTMRMIPVLASSFADTVSQQVMADEDAYDLLVLHNASFTKLLYAGDFLRLDTLDALDFSKPWWCADSVSSYAYDGQLYCANGMATAVSMVGYTNAIFFNQDMAAEFALENLYDVVRDGRWTAEYFKKVCADVYVDVNGDGKVDAGDRLGIHIPYGPVHGYVWNLGGKYVDTIDGTPTLQIGTERMEKLYETFRSMLTWKGVYQKKGWEPDIYKKGNTLFAQCCLTWGDGFRELDFASGILPAFKLDETQQFYTTGGGGSPQAILTTNRDPRRAALLMEAINAESYRRVIPAVYEQTARHKLAPDEDSTEMIDLIMEHLIFDGSFVFCPDATYMLYDYGMTNKGFASYMAEKAEMLSAALSDTLAAFAEIGE